MAGNASMNSRDLGSRLPVEFEQLLQREMAIEPSPEFLPRVRERISSNQKASRGRWRWIFALGTAAAACIAIVMANGLGTAPAPAPSAPGAPALAMAQPIQPVGMPSVMVADAPRAVVQALPVGETVAPRTPPATGNPPVIVDERQRAALATLIRIIRDGQLTSDSFALTTPVSLEGIRDQVKPVQVGPLTVSPIPADGVLQGER